MKYNMMSTWMIIGLFFNFQSVLTYQSFIVAMDGSEGSSLLKLMKQKKEDTQEIQRKTRAAAYEAKRLTKVEDQFKKWRLQEKELEERYTGKEFLRQQLREEATRKRRARLEELEMLETGIGLWPWD